MKEFTQEKINILNNINDKAKELFDQHDYSGAIKCFEQIGVEDFPEEFKPNLARCYYYNRQAPKALELLASCKSLGDTDTQLDAAIYENAIGNFDFALQVYETLDQSDSRVRFNIGWHLMRKGNFKKAFELLEEGSKCRAWGHEYIHLENDKIDIKKRWHGNQTQTLLLFLEGGIGDCLIFLRWSDYLKTKCKKLIIAVPEKLCRLLSNAGYDVIPDYSIPTLEYDHYVPGMSIPNFIDVNHPLDKVRLPYVQSISEPYITRGMDILSSEKNKNLKIGVKWMGNPEFEHDQFRTIPKQAFYDLNLYGSLFSLQLEENEDDDHFIPCRHVIKDWQDTYSVFSGLDLLVTSCTSTAHLAGAMNLPTIVIVPLVCYFVWANDDLRWYESVTVVRQTKYNDWSDAITNMYSLVESFANKYK